MSFIGKYVFTPNKLICHIEWSWSFSPWTRCIFSCLNAKSCWKKCAKCLILRTLSAVCWRLFPHTVSYISNILLNAMNWHITELICMKTNWFGELTAQIDAEIDRDFCSSNFKRSFHAIDIENLPFRKQVYNISQFSTSLKKLNHSFEYLTHQAGHCP